MPFDDFLLEFRDLYIAEINDKASYVYESFHDPEAKGVYFTIQIVHEGLYSFQIDNTPERRFTGDKQLQYRYPPSHLEVKKVGEEGKVSPLFETTSKKRTLCHA